MPKPQKVKRIVLSKYFLSVCFAFAFAAVGSYVIFFSKASPTIAADFNSDGTVNIFDLSILASNWNRTAATNAMGDANYDNTVNIFDLSMLASQWGQTGNPTPTPSITPTPTPTSTPTGSIIINHSSSTLSKFQSIPINNIDNSKSNLNIVYWHTSHGSQLLTGTRDLIGFSKRGTQYCVTGGSGCNSSNELTVVEPVWDDLGDTNWPNVTRTYLNANPSINTVMWSWCGQVSTADANYINSYLSNMSQLEREYPNVKFVYMTGHLDGSGVSGNLNQRNEQIRRYAIDNRKILYDFADIESFNPNGIGFLDRGATDGCDYNSGNWCIEWQNSHQLGVDWFQTETAHSQPLIGNQKAYGAWYLWARLAGWAGN